MNAKFSSTGFWSGLLDIAALAFRSRAILVLCSTAWIYVRPIPSASPGITIVNILALGLVPLLITLWLPLRSQHGHLLVVGIFLALVAIWITLLTVFREIFNRKSLTSDLQRLMHRIDRERDSIASGNGSRNQQDSRR